jgi:hypothetical protein
MLEHFPVRPFERKICHTRTKKIEEHIAENAMLKTQSLSVNPERQLTAGKQQIPASPTHLNMVEGCN